MKEANCTDFDGGEDRRTSWFYVLGGSQGGHVRVGSVVIYIIFSPMCVRNLNGQTLLCFRVL